MAELVIKHLFKDYRLANKSKFQAIEDINLSFKKGELVSIVGESGSGKSTLMNVIGGLDSDFRGEIIVGGQNIKNLKEKELDEYRKKKIGFVFQSFNLIPHLSVLDNVTIALTLSNIKQSEKEEKAMALLKRLGLENHIKKKPNQLSGGQKQRVAIARALINDPDIILADEPTGALDSVTTLQILDILKEIADEGKLVIMVTHSEKVASISSRVVELSDGKIVRDEKVKGYRKGKTKGLTVEPTQKKEKSHLSLISAIKLSFHNMYASKVKNLLIAFGVSISLISLILMLAFGSGLTDYISSTADQYNDPNYVTISKSFEVDESGNVINGTIFNPLPFKDENEINTLLDDIDEHLKEKNPDYSLNRDEVSYGFSMMSMTGGATYKFKVNEDGVYDKNGTLERTGSILFIYSTPPYYQDKILAGKLGGLNEVMFSKALVKQLGFNSAEELIENDVTLSINLEIGGLKLNTSEMVSDELTGDPTVAGILDVSAMFEGMPILYVDYHYLSLLVEKAQPGFSLPIHTIYIHTGDEKVTNIINNHLDELKKYTGSLEERLANMFNQMISVFSTALAIIAGISLIVSAIMILVVLYMSVTERTREIGVLKSIGARRKDIRLIFTAESFLIGVLSGVVGCILALVAGGILIGVLQTLLGATLLSFRWYYFAIALGLSIVISMLSGLMPASKASKLDPVEALRHD